MITSSEDAKDSMFSIAQDAVESLFQVLSYVPEIRWQGVENNNAPLIDKMWVRVAKFETDEDKKYVSNANGNKILFNHIGILSIELFGPKTDITSYEYLDKCASIIKNSFRGKVSNIGIRFKKAKSIEVPNDNLWYKINVIIEYEYDEEGLI